MNTFRIKDLRFRILKGGKIGLCASIMMFGMLNSTLSAAPVINDGRSGAGVFVGSQFYDATINNLNSNTEKTGTNTNLTVGNNTDTTVFTNYFTEGGAGSGGGAGLGGVFFVNQGSTLTLNNTIFSFNTVKGGEGGSLPAQVIEDTNIIINQLSLGLTGFEQQQINPTLTYSGGTYSFKEIAVATGTKLLNKDSGVVFSELGGNSSTIASVTDSSITLSQAISMDNTKYSSIENPDSTNEFYGTGYTIDNTGSKTVINFNYIVDPNSQTPITNHDLITQIKEKMTFNAIVAANNGSITSDNATIEKVNYDSNGNVSSVVLSKKLNNTVISSASSLDIIPVTKFETKPYVVSGNTITITGATRGFKEGMIIYDNDGNSTGVKITDVSSDGKRLTVSGDTSALNTLGSITAKSTPFLAADQIKLSAPNPDLEGADSVKINGTDYGIKDYDSETGVVTLKTAVDSDIRNDIENDGELLTLKVNTVSINDNENTITLVDKGQEFTTGMQLKDTDLTISGVSKVNGKIVLTIAGTDSSKKLASLAESDSLKILALDPLTTGGSMNNLASTGKLGTNGRNGINSNYYSAFFAEGEGQSGTNGYSGGDGDGAAGGNAGDGGNGSNGLPVNPQLMSELWGATGDFTDAVEGLAVALVPEGIPIPSPEIADIPGAIIDLTMASIDLSTAIANTVFWAQNLNAGIAGMGGAGGDGGDGGSGDEFFGGGSGGAGGNGGEGALSFTDGGSGGAGGLGGYGGFGAGGGSGGAGGTAGSTGAADDGDPGDGGRAGFAAGDGSNGDGLYGNGGSGFGGAIFVREGGTLNITGNTLFENNMTIAGSSNNGGEQGENAGSAIFMMKNSTVNLMPGLGNKIIFNDDIGDNSGSTYDSASYASGSGADIHIKGNGGLVEFNAENTYSGKTILEGATLKAQLGMGINDRSKIVFKGAGDTTTSTNTLNLGSVGTLLLDEDLTTRRVGTRSIDVAWEGSGGIASGIEEGIVVNFAQLNDGTGQTLNWGTNGTGQTLNWGTNGFFASAADKVLTFGSEQSLGSVDFRNNVNIGLNNTASVGVYNTNSEDNVNSSTAILSGNWVGNELMVGSSTYKGNLVLTGTNELDKLTILDGTTSVGTPSSPLLRSASSGTISDDNTNTIVKMYGGTLILNNGETLDNVSVDSGALLVSNADLTVVKGIQNNGQIVVNTGTFNDDIINDAQFANGGNISVNANIINDNVVDGTTAQWNQIGEVNADNITNNGNWYNQANVTLASTLINNGTWTSGQIDTEQNYVSYEDSLKTIVSLTSLVGTGTFNISNGDLEISQSGTSTFDGDITGQGAFVKSGNGILTVSQAQEFGKLNVNAGEYISLAEHLLNSVLVDANGTFTMNANTTTQTNFKNDGLVKLNANLTTGTDFENNGTTIALAPRTITTIGGLKGSGDIQTANTLTLAQSGDTTYSGTIKGTGSFVKNGTGNLTLTGVAGSVDLDAGTLVNAGTLTTDSSNVFAQDQNITVSTTGTLHVKTGTQNLSTVTNNGTVNLDDNITLVTLTNTASGTFNQDANITSIDAIMDGNWNVTGNQTLNTNTLTGDATVTLAEYLKINQTGTSTFDGSISGNGKLEKTGNGTLKISDVQTFLGGLDVTGGTFETLENSRLADTLAINVKANSTFIAGAVDTVGSVLVDATGTFTMNANTTTQTNFKNDGLVNLNANLTTGTDFENNGTTIALAPKTITTVGGLKGSGNIQTADTLTLAQSGDTTYSGTIKGTGSFVKNGTGNLTLNGSAGSVDLGTQLVINGGILGLDGANILASTLDVLINNNGTMQLINGNQRIDALAGSGLINLGSNKLEVNDGGTFAGTVVGNGTLDIKNGQFTVSSDITSTEGTFNVNDGATTTINQDSNLTFPTVEVQTGGTLNIEGNVEASNNVVVHTAGTLHLTNGGNIDTNLASIYGTLNGIGSITGTTTAYAGSYLRPGNSPGSITFDDLVLDNNSTTVMEIETTQTAGTTFDQIIVNNNLTIKNGAKLDLVKFGVGTELAQGEKAKIFDFTPGKISGYFTDVTSSYTNDTILNLQTGEVVGLGGTTIAQFENGVTSNANQMKILTDLKVNQTNGVAQYYGGEIASRLASNQGNATETKKIFETFSPEVYSSLLEQNKFNLLSSTSKLPTDLENTKAGLSISMDRNTYETDKNDNFMSYKMEGNEIKIDHTGKFNEGFIVTSVNAIDGDINSEYTEGSTQNYGINIAAVQPLGSENLTFRAQAGYIKGDTDLSRKTYDSTSYANNIDSSGLMAGLGLGYDKKFSNFKLATTLDVLYYKSNVDGFTESNANSLDALNIHKQDENGVVSKLKVKATKDLTENLSVSGKVEYNKFFNSDNNKVTANVALEDTLMNVENPGIGNDIIGLGLGLDYKVNKEWSAEFNAGISGDKDLTQNSNVGVQIKYAF